MKQETAKKITIWAIVIVVILILAVILILWLRNRNRSIESDMTIATIWDAPYNSFEKKLVFENASRNVLLQRRGFERGLRENQHELNIHECLIQEGKDSRAFTTDIAEIYNRDDVLMGIGGSTDEATMYASMELNYFDIPFLIPFADGDLSSSSGSAVSMRMTPTANNYAEFFGNLFPAYLISYINGYVFENLPVPDYTIDLGVFFANNFNGHETSVKVTQQLMDNGMNIDVYQAFDSDDLYRTVRTLWDENESLMSSLDAVIILAEDHDELVDLSNTLGIWRNRGLSPQFIVTGYYPTEFDASLSAMDNLFIVQQSIGFDSCPSDIVSRSEAMGYAAGYITSEALRRAKEATPPENVSLFWWLRTESQNIQLHQDYLNTLRNNIHTAIQNISGTIPCYGFIDFNSSDDNRAQLEIVRITNLDQFAKIDPSVIFYRMVNIVRNDFGLGSVSE